MQKTDLSFLVGQFESVAYELAQDHGFTVRIVNRDGKAFICTRDYRLDRANFTVSDNRVIRVTIG